MCNGSRNFILIILHLEELWSCNYTEISGCHSSSIEIDDHDNAENVDRGDAVINGCCSPYQGSTEINVYSGIESDIHENNIATSPFYFVLSLLVPLFFCKTFPLTQH